MPHVATDSISDSSMLAGGIFSSISSPLNLFDQGKVAIAVIVRGMDALAWDCKGMGNQQALVHARFGMNWRRSSRKCCSC